MSKATHDHTTPALTPAEKRTATRRANKARAAMRANALRHEAESEAAAIAKRERPPLDAAALRTGIGFLEALLAHEYSRLAEIEAKAQLSRWKVCRLPVVELAAWRGARP